MPYTIKPAEDAILRSMYVFPYLTGKQLTRLLYSPGSYKEVLAKLKRLYDNGYVLRKPLPSHIQAGSVPYVYWLATVGRHYLQTLGYDFTNWRNPSDMKLVHSAHLWHVLAVNDVLIAGANLASTHADLRLADIRHDFTLKRTMQAPVIPDGWLDFRIREHEQQCIWLELDRGTEKLHAVKSKIERLVAYATSGYAQHFGTPAITIAVATTEGEHRIREMVAWCEQQLAAMGEVQEADLFRFIALPEQYDASLYITPVWSVPFVSHKRCLLDV